MRKSLIALCVLLLSVGLVAQTRSGNIYGKVTDPEGNPLPGVTVTLTGQYTAPQVQVTTAEGAFRFLSLPPSKDYSLKMELSGFKSKTESAIIVIVGGNTNLTLSMEVGVLEEQVTVTAVTPMVDSKKTSVGTNVTQDILQSLPSARDPWVVLQMAPSIIVDRENIGGAESGQQSNYVARGSDTYNNNVWAMDGIVITDPAAIGASPSYYDFDAFEEMQITVGGADVTVQTGGIALNMVTRRGGNNVTLGGRFYFVDEKFQAKNEDKVAELKKTEKYFLGINKIKNNKDYGFNLGVPIIRDKAWFWMSYGIQDIKTTTVYTTADDTLLENYVGKINLQIIPQNRFEAFAHIGGKKKYGRSTSYENPEGLYQQGRYHFGSPIVKLQDEHMFGDNLFVSLKWAYSDAGFSLTPMVDLAMNKLPIWDVTDQRYYSSQSTRYYVERPVYQYNALVNYFNDGLIGASHDIKLGFEYATRRQYVESTWSGNCMVNRNYNSPTIDWTGDGLPDTPPAAQVPYFNYFSFWRGYYADQLVDAFAGYFSDTITFGRFNILLGLRWDQQTPSLRPFKVAAMTGNGAWDTIAPDNVQKKLDSLLPGVSFDAIKATYADGSAYKWTVWSPRIGVTWDATGDGKTLLKLSLAQYGDFMGTGTADRWRRGGVGGWFDMWWWDADHSGMMSLDELYWDHPADSSLYHIFDSAGNFIGDWNDAAGYRWGDYDNNNPLATTAPYQTTAKGSGSSRTSEAMLTLDREILTDFSASLILSYRKYDKFNWTLRQYKDASGNTTYFQSKDLYVSAGAPGKSVPGIPDTKDAADKAWYYQSTRLTDYTPYTQVQLRPDYNQNYWGVDLVLNKRLSHKWMMNANFTWQSQAQHYGDNGYLDPTNLWAYEGYPQAAYIGGASGKISQYTYARWMGKIGGLYQLPFDINVSGTFNIREGWVVDEYFQIVDYRLPNAKSRSNNLRMSPFGSERLPMFYNLSLRLEKMLRLGDTGRIYVMADLFNALNSTIENRRYQKYVGTAYIYPNSAQNKFVPYVQYFALNEIINPRVMRVGVRFTF